MYDIVHAFIYSKLNIVPFNSVSSHRPLSTAASRRLTGHSPVARLYRSYTVT